MSSDLLKLDRIRSIKNKDVKHVDTNLWTVTSQSDKHKEVTYSVMYLTGTKLWYCSCKDFLFKSTEDNPDYECKHIGKVRDMLLKLKRLNK